MSEKRSGKSEGILDASWQLMLKHPSITVVKHINGDPEADIIPADLKERIIIPWPPLSSHLELNCAPTDKCPDCKGAPGPYKFCNNCADKRMHAHLAKLHQTAEKIWINSPFASLYVAETPFNLLEQCIWKGWLLNQLPKCVNCHRNAVWDDLEAVQAVKCKHVLVVCNSCKKCGISKCDACSISKRRGMDTDLIWIDKMKPVPSEFWRSVITPFSKPEETMEEVD